jgi:predicted deacylase
MAALVVHDFSRIDWETPGKRHYQLAFHLDGTWGYSLVPLTVVCGVRGSSPDGVAIFGGTHGNEYEAQVAVKRLCRDLEPGEMRGRVVLMPRLSESACEANRRESPLDGVNMNRAFPGSARGSISYRIANFVKREVFPRVRVVLDIHSGGKEGVFPVCTSFHPIPDPGQRAEIEKVARLFDTPFILIYSSQMASGLLTDEAEAEGKITIGGEFGAGESVSRIGTLHAYEGVRNVLRHYGLLPGSVERIRADDDREPLLVTAESLEDYRPCPVDAVWEPAVDLGATVCSGELLGRLHDFSDLGEATREVRAHRDGYVLMMHLSARVHRGMTLYVIAREATTAGAPA